MLYLIPIFFLTMIMGCDSHEEASDQSEAQIMETKKKADYALVIHGGAGVILRENLSKEIETAYLAALNEALDQGEAILKSGGKAIDAVIAAITSMEDNPLFNAGKGAVFTNEGLNEMDASLMDGSDLNAGVVGGVTNIKNPILAARAVLEKSEHVFLTQKGAEQFAREQGLEIVDPQYFYTERRWKSLNQAKDSEIQMKEMTPDQKHGTVGAVAMDKSGNLVAGTSTGGMTNKRYNRFGDVPVIGAGTYANNNSCAVSCTGHGEYFIRWTVAHDVSALMQYKEMSLQEATDEVVMKKLKEAGGSGGLIAVSKDGEVSMTFNSPGMYRGYITSEKREVKIYEE